MATAQSRVTDMTRGDPVRLLLNFSAPLFLSNLLQQFYNLADTALAGHILGDAALAENRGYGCPVRADYELCFRHE